MAFSDEEVKALYRTERERDYEWRVNSVFTVRGCQVYAVLDDGYVLADARDGYDEGEGWEALTALRGTKEGDEEL